MVGTNGNRWRRGLIVGKFYPPHAGHKYLINTAKSQVDELYVIICGKPHHEPSGELRAAWLQELHPDIKVLVIDDQLDADDSQAWADNSVHWLGFVPDVVFTSEGYGDSFAQCLGCEHVCVDLTRRAVPISATRVRQAPLACWEYLEAPVKGYYALRVCLVGAESTGKTTLAQLLADQFKTVWVPEFGREYSLGKMTPAGYEWREEDFVHIAAEQCTREDALARQANRILICDTDAFVTSVWHQRYMGTKSSTVEQIVANHRRPDLYLLTDINTRFVQDGTRDGEHIRHWMHALIETELCRRELPFQRLSGSLDKQVASALSYIECTVTEFRNRKRPTP